MNETTAFYLAQCFSILTGLLAVIMMQMKNMKSILIFQIILNLTTSLNYILLGGDSGAFISILAIIQAVVMYLLSIKKKKPHLYVILVFIFCYALASAYSIASNLEIIGLLPALAAICYCLSLVQEKASAFRVWGALNPLFWLIYDVLTKSYIMFLVHLGVLISSVVAMIRIDGIFKRSRN